jgi:hypothetical protein
MRLANVHVDGGLSVLATAAGMAQHELGGPRAPEP